MPIEKTNINIEFCVANVVTWPALNENVQEYMFY